MIRPDEMPYRSGLTYRDGVPITYDAADYVTAFDRLIERLEYADWRAEQARRKGTTRPIGIGLCAYVEGTGLGPFEGADVHVDPGGTVFVHLGVCAQGQGHETTFAQICADVLSVPVESVIVKGGDTQLVGYGMGTIASRVAAVAGPAVARSAGEVADKARLVAAEMLECDPKDIVLADGRVHVKGVPGKSLRLAEVARAAVRSRALARTSGPGLHACGFFYPDSVTWAFGVQGVVVEVDVEACSLTLLRHVAMHDCGRPINPMIVEGQLHGGLAQGIGTALSEELLYDEAGPAPHRHLHGVWDAARRPDAGLRGGPSGLSLGGQPARHQGRGRERGHRAGRGHRQCRRGRAGRLRRRREHGAAHGTADLRDAPRGGPLASIHGNGIRMTREHRFAQVDVFTDRVFGGNPLAVVFDADGLGDAEMQAIAREMNLSETTFLLPPTRPECAARVRIFTPAREVPFAGHPTIGTSWVLATEGLLPQGATRFFLEEAIGPVEVELEGDPARPSFLWMRHGEAMFGPELANRAAFAAALGLAEADLWPGAPICTGSTGSAFLFVPLRDKATVDRAALDVPRIQEAMGEGPNLGVFVFAADPDPKAGRVYSRMFAPHTSGIPEDPATGSASGPLGAYLVTHGLVAPAPSVCHRQRAGHQDGPAELRPYQDRDARRADQRAAGRRRRRAGHRGPPSRVTCTHEREENPMPQATLPPWIETLKQRDPEFVASYMSQREKILADGAIPAKYKHLMTMIVDALLAHADGVATIANRARAAGASEAEILEAVEVAYLFGGTPGLVTAVNAFRT